MEDLQSLSARSAGIIGFALQADVVVAIVAGSKGSLQVAPLQGRNLITEPFLDFRHCRYRV